MSDGGERPKCGRALCSLVFESTGTQLEPRMRPRLRTLLILFAVATVFVYLAVGTAYLISQQSPPFHRTRYAHGSDADGKP